MFGILKALLDRCIPDGARRERSSLMRLRVFVFLHWVGPTLGQSVILFLWRVSAHPGWQFWTLEACVASFWFLPPLIRVTGSLLVPAILSVQLLVFLSLFGSFFYGGISSPFLPWFLIALLTGFFFLAEKPLYVVLSVIGQLIAFIGARLLAGGFDPLLPLSSLRTVNLISITTALICVLILSLYYDRLMRVSSELEAETRAHRARTEEMLEAFKRADQANHQKSIFLSKMSHALRTPLNAVIGYSEMLREELGAEPANPQRAQDLERINAAGRHLLALVTDILDLSRIETSRVEVAAAPVAIGQLLRDAIATVEPIARKKGNALRLEMPRDPGTVMADPLKLRQSILNLLSNAAKFTERGTITLGVRIAGDRLLLWVRDTGIGISQEGIGRLFQAFSQAETDTSQRFGGTGLGLALTRRFCTLMGGSIAVESAPGEGSCFTIDLPLARPEAEAGPDPRRRQAEAA